MAVARGTQLIARLSIAAGAVLAWMLAGWTLHLGPDGYLLAGVPLTVAFQLLVARRSLTELWLRDGRRPRADASFWALLVIFVAYPFSRFVHAVSGSIEGALWMLCAIAGAVGAAMTVRFLTRTTIRDMAMCLLIAGGIGIALMLSAYAARSSRAAPSLGLGVRSLLLYFPVAHILEEVFFRGALDSYVHRQGKRDWFTAAVISALWGVWHLPILPSVDPVRIVGVMIVHMLIGVPLSIYWRRSGNLAVPSSAHALIDAVRNGLKLR